MRSLRTDVFGVGAVRQRFRNGACARVAVLHFCRDMAIRRHARLNALRR